MVTLDDTITIYAGATFVRDFGYATRAGASAPKVHVDLTGCKLRLQIRAKVPDASALAAPTVANGGTVLLSFTTENDGIVITDAAEGKYSLRMTDEQTALLTSWKKGIGDLEIEFPDGTVKRLWRATFEVSPEVTL